MVIDLDYFKTINDRFGHDVGDGYLESTAAAVKQGLGTFGSGAAAQTRRLSLRLAWRLALGTRLRGEFRTPFGARAYRIGGEEFALLTPEPDTRQAEALARHVMAQVRGVRHRANPGGELTCSVGVAQCLSGESPTLTQRRADASLLLAKANGRSRAEVASVGASRVRLTPGATAAVGGHSRQPESGGPRPRPDTGRLDPATPGRHSERAGRRIRNHQRPAGRTVRADCPDRLQRYPAGPEPFRERTGRVVRPEPRTVEPGQPRVLYGEAIAASSDSRAAGSEQLSEQFKLYGRVTELRASLCIPVIMDGEVVGYLNLDRSSDERPFDEEDLRVARVFADQVTVLTVAARRRGTLERQRREQAWLLEFSLDLLTLSDTARIADALLTKVNAFYGLEGTLEFGTLEFGAADLPETRNGPPPCRLDLDWPGEPGAHLLFRRHQLSPQEQALLRQASRADNTALATLRLRRAVAG
ncbi:diguanylate cyclase [Deinococcus radiomollis]|uniref:diguanylate cyclase domain-containing protein n=1 Tax=Deinococcus radiomollis TaxID=468916 RepID=UPI00389153CC